MTKKKILAVFLSLIMLIGLFPMSAFAENTVAVSVETAASAVNKGDEVEFTVYLGDCSGIASAGGLYNLDFNISVPTGLTFKTGSGVIDGNFATASGFTAPAFNEATMKFTSFGALASGYVGGKIPVMKFFCTVDDDATGDMTVTLENVVLPDVTTLAPFTPEIIGVTVTVGGAETVDVTGVTVSPTSAELTAVGETKALTATVAPDNATNKAVTWSSDNTGVATVSADGVVTAVANGTAKITVTTVDGGKTAECIVTVASASADALGGTVTISGTTKYSRILTAVTTELDYGSESKGTLSYQWLRNGKEITSATGEEYTLTLADIGANISVRVSNSKNSGNVTSEPVGPVTKEDGGLAPDTVVVEATYNKVNIVGSPAPGVEYAIVEGDGEAPETGWNETGVFEGLNANRLHTLFLRYKATETTEASAVRAIPITTAKIPQAISSTVGDKLSIKVGKTVKLNDIFASNAPGAELTYKVTDDIPEDVVFDTDNKTITAGSTTGTFTLKVNSAAVGDYEAAEQKNIEVTITEKDSSAFKAGFDAAVEKTYGDEPFTKAAVLTAGNGDITYSSSNTDVATVDGNGKVTILSAGETTITAAAAETADYAAASTSYALTVKKATITVTALNKVIYTGAAAPDLSSPVLGTDYTVKGLAAGDSLAKAPVLAYAETPNTSTAGTYTITAKDAEVPEGGNYNSTIVYNAGTLTVKASSSSSSGGGGGGGGTSLYSIVVKDTENGSLKLNYTTAKKGSTVTITVTPDDGFALDAIKAVDAKGNTIELKEKDGKYTFTMPAAKATVSAEFVSPEGEETTDKPVDAPSIILTIGKVEAVVFGETVVNDVAPVIRNERTMLPARFVAEALGAEVDWNDAERKVTITKGETAIVIFIDSAVAFINGDAVELDSPAFIENSRTYLPVRFISEALDADVEWNAETQEVYIY